jgi:type II restriction/modification system DNA methylase subunit YeeA
MKKTARNDVTGDWLQSKPNNEQFEKNWDLIFGKKEKFNRRNIKPEIFTIPKEKHVHTMLPEYELNKSTGEVQKVDHGDTTDTQK